MDITNLKGLTTQGMVGATAPWVDPAQDRPLLSNIGMVRGYLSALDGAHGKLVAQQVAQNDGAVAAQLKALNAEAAVLDAAHDAHIRGIACIIDGHIALAAAPDEAEALSSLKARVLPDGASAVNRTYLEEAGETELASTRIDAATRAQLAAIPTKGGNLKVAVDAWLSAGKRLGGVAREQARLSAGGSSGAVTPADVLSARNQWIKVVRAILAGLELEDGLDEATRARLLQPLKIACDKASRTPAAAAPIASAPTATPTTAP